MNIDKDRLSELIYDHLQGLSLSAEQQALLDAWLAAPVNRELFETGLNEEAFREYLSILTDTASTGRALATFESNVFSGTRSEDIHPGVRRLQRTWLRYAAAAILIAGAGLYLIFSARRKSDNPVMALPAIANDVAPGSSKAVLTLANGTHINLDTAGNGALASQGRTKIVKTAGGQIFYQQDASGGDEVLMNTMQVPRGGQYQLTLPDGTKVWLNAASSISYPTAFTGRERKVSIVGEAYFEVAKKADMPFQVKIGDQAEVLVLGTSFNVNAYENEADIRATLLDGSIKIERKQKSLVLTPGQQAQLSVGLPATAADGTIRIVDHADVDKVMAWKNGYFNFDDTHFNEAMRQLERWYDIEVVYENGIPDIPLGGETSRNLKLSDLLKGLKGAGVNFRLEKGRRLVVLR